MRWMAAYFAAMFQEVRPGRSLILILSLTDPDIKKQKNFTDDEINKNENLALEKLHCQKVIKRILRFTINRIMVLY